MSDTGRCVSVTLTFEDGSERTYEREVDDYIVMADSAERDIQNIAMAGGTEKNVVMLKILDQVITGALMGVNPIGPDAAKKEKGT